MDKGGQSRKTMWPEQESIMKQETRKEIKETIERSSVLQSLLTAGILRKPSKAQTLACLGYDPESTDEEQVKEAKAAMSEAAAVIGSLLPLGGKLLNLTACKLASRQNAEGWHRGESALSQFLEAARTAAVKKALEAWTGGKEMYQARCLYTIGWRGEREAVNRDVAALFLKAAGFTGLSKLSQEQKNKALFKAWTVDADKRNGSRKVTVDRLFGMIEFEWTPAPVKEAISPSPAGPAEADAASTDEVPAGVVSMADALSSAKPAKSGKKVA